MATFALVISTSKKLAPLVSEALFRAGAQGLEERAGRAVELVTYDTRRASLSALWNRAERSLRELLPPAQLPSATIEVDDLESWKTAWTEHLRPVELTPRLVLSPTSAADVPLRHGQHVVRYRPALAFGDGGHPTTRLAARAIEAHYRRQPGGQLLDIGTGSGVLSLVALLSGAGRALGTDIDPAAIAAATKNAQLNELSRRARFAHSSTRIRGAFDLVVINIELRPLLEVLAELPVAARRAPRLLVTGFLSTQGAQVTSAVKAAGFLPHRKRSEQDWVLLEARR